MKILIEKGARQLTLFDTAGAVVFRCRAGLGRADGPKQKSGDLRTPEGRYHVCLLKPEGKYGPSLGLSYPAYADAEAGVRSGIIGPELLPLFRRAEESGARPPWGTALGGEIYIHAGGSADNWTAGCVALEPEDMDRLFSLCGIGTEVEIRA